MEDFALTASTSDVCRCIHLIHRIHLICSILIPFMQFLLRPDCYVGTSSVAENGQEVGTRHEITHHGDVFLKSLQSREVFMVPGTGYHHLPCQVSPSSSSSSSSSSYTMNHIPLALPNLEFEFI